ncbi:hypothetical protein GJ744_007220 [Endocarpon pusillum]|uniref:Uncharacterized protein n=1 Tax=Endocarpon pusillum TaxID=364733 RepID=A0A8H7E0P5_9EURO|nr:hypothetical protein GJ744_007220 [Endocarpon pusillum]
MARPSDKADSRNMLERWAFRGDIKMVQMLLDKGADVNAQGEVHGNALQAASYQGHEKVVQMLLDKGADINAPGEVYGNALQAASYQGNEKVVQMLLDEGADANAQGGPYGNALQAASYLGHEKVVQMLLDEGVDVNAQGGPYGNALQAASEGGNEKLAQMLLDKGARYRNLPGPRVGSKEPSITTPRVDASGPRGGSKGSSIITPRVDAPGPRDGGKGSSGKLPPFGKPWTDKNPYARAEAADVDRKAQQTAVNKEESLKRSGETSSLGHDLDVLETVRETITQAASTDSLPLSAGRVYKFRYMCNWMLPIFMKDQFKAGTKVADVVTLTGKAKNAQAATCSEYLNSHWPTVGSFLLKVIEVLIEKAGSFRKIHSKLEADNHFITARHIPTHGAQLGSRDTYPTSFEISACLETQIQIAQALCWFSAAVRSPPSQSRMKSKIRFESSSNKKDPSDACFDITMHPVEPFEAENMCWHHVFKNCVIAVQFPIAPREQGQGVGLEIPSALMTTLAGIVRAVEFQGGIILKGLQTALIPIEELEGGGAIQWHLYVTDSMDGSIELKDPISGKQDIQFLKVQDVQRLLCQKRAYLGWCQKAKVLLGTIHGQYDAVTYSKPSCDVQRFECTGFTLGGVLNILGWGGLTANVQFAIAKGMKTSFMDADRSLKERLEKATIKPCTVYDTTTRRGWLVPQACLLLHMMHLKQRELTQLKGCSSDKEMPFSSTEGDPGKEASKVLVSNLREGSTTALGSSDDWERALLEIYTGLDWLAKQVHESKDKADRADKSHIVGCDILKIINVDEVLETSRRKIGSGGWAKIAMQTHYTLFCSNLGDALIPDNGENKICEQCSSVPCHADLFAAYVPCLAKALKDGGNAEQSQRLCNGTHATSLYENCPACSGDQKEICFKRHIKNYEKLWNLLSRSTPAGAPGSTELTYRTECAGAMIFGNRKVLTGRNLQANLPMQRSVGNSTSARSIIPDESARLGPGNTSSSPMIRDEEIQPALESDRPNSVRANSHIGPRPGSTELQPAPATVEAPKRVPELLKSHSDPRRRIERASTSGSKTALPHRDKKIESPHADKKTGSTIKRSDAGTAPRSGGKSSGPRSSDTNQQKDKPIWR